MQENHRNGQDDNEFVDYRTFHCHVSCVEQTYCFVSRLKLPKQGLANQPGGHLSASLIVNQTVVRNFLKSLLQTEVNLARIK